ncbi:MAG: outer membrane protein assembly factor BamD [Candidatus Marinimicrobia bacterium]|nr:outer membrane protein assembly factor BamD [Candidatus Neomarinimicrobiota bacterium]MCF7827700.1 outer membrane protein assembly factor BamD [Candidatus Neomarinimicrobiota bacterium]MCF7881245.1 outer membrane protein assembly factor BamD [Candidatus Neomarinimicrobiota bacterium]
MRTTHWFTLLLTAIIFLGCNRGARREQQDVEFRFNRGKEYFQDEKYYKAIEDFNYVVLNNPGGEHADDAQLFVADAHYELSEYVVASSEYRRLMRRYPESPLVEQAQYKLGMCLVELSPHYQLEQQYTRQAINTMQSFLESYPYSQYAEELTGLIDELRAKLAHKMYSNGHLYYVLRQYDSAIIYYDELLSQYYDTPWANITRLERAKSLMNLDRDEEAITQIRELLNRDPEEEIRIEAESLLQELSETPAVADNSKDLE